MGANIDSIMLKHLSEDEFLKWKHNLDSLGGGLLDTLSEFERTPKRILNYSFIWRDSEEGDEYWRTVAKRL